MKKISVFTICMVLLIAACFPLTAMALNADQIITEIAESPFGYYEGTPAITPEETRPGHEIIIPILAEGFKNEQGADIIWKMDSLGSPHKVYKLGPSKSDLRQNDIGVRIEVAARVKVIRDYEIVAYTPTRGVPAQAAVRIRFVEDLVSTEQVRYQFSIYLTHNGKKVDMGETFGGIISNPEIEVYSHDYVDLTGGYVADAGITTKEIQVEMGNSVSLYSDMVKDERYYGIAKHTGNDGQDLIAKTYPQITHVYDLHTINLKTSGNLVKINGFDEPYFVYNLKGEYLGTTDDRLAYSTRYYLSASFLTIEVDQDELEKSLSSQYPEPFPSAAVEAFTEGLLEDARINSPVEILP